MAGYVPIDKARQIMRQALMAGFVIGLMAGSSITALLLCWHP